MNSYAKGNQSQYWACTTSPFGYTAGCRMSAERDRLECVICRERERESRTHTHKAMVLNSRSPLKNGSQNTQRYCAFSTLHSPPHCHPSDLHIPGPYDTVTVSVTVLQSLYYSVHTVHGDYRTLSYTLCITHTLVPKQTQRERTYQQWGLWCVCPLCAAGWRSA